LAEHRDQVPETVRVWLLGGFRISVGSRTIEGDEWRLRKAAALVKVLSLASGHRLHREQAMDLLWPEANTKAASNNLRTTLHATRQVLDSMEGSRYLASEEESLVLCPPGGQLWVDVEALEEAAAGARRSRDSAAYRVALELYSGELLPEDRYEEWTEGRREELRQLYLGLLMELAGLYEERDEFGLAIEVLRKATATEPTFEEGHVGLMRLHAFLGCPERSLAQYERLRDALSRVLGTKPAATTRRLRDEIAVGRLPLTPSAAASSQEEKPPRVGKHNLPAPRTSFVGREREMAAAKREIAMTRLLTLTGAGGSGKTRLALEVGRDLIGAYPDGVWLVELAPLSEPGLVAQEVAGSLEVPERPGEPLTDTLVDALGDKGLLLILDNCEHLVEGAARLMDTLLDSCPHLRVLATSREPLGVGGEVLWQVRPLSLPDTNGESNGGSTVESLIRYEAVRLFVDRARLRLPDFGLSEENAGAVAKVCRGLDGIPLAIELATARMGALAVEQVAQRLEASLGLLSSGSRTAEPRQQTLRATLNWSYDLLSEAEHVLFGRLSVFAGGWTLEAAETLCSGDGIEEEDVLDLLGALVDKSLVVARASTKGGAVRYRMLEPIRQYAREKLDEGGEANEVRGQHAAFFLTLAQEAELDGPEQRLWVERLEVEHDNLREALSWTLEWGEANLGLRFGGAIWRFWYNRGYLSEGIRWMGRVLEGSEPTASPVRVKALEGMGWLTQMQADFGRAEATYEEMLELSRELGDKGSVATALNSLGTMAVQQGDHDRARALLQENMEVLRELEEEGNPATTLKRFHALNLLGYLAIYEQDDYAEGTALWEESLELARGIGDPNHVGVMLSNLGHPALLQGDFERARELSEEALAFAQKLGTSGVEFALTAYINLGLALLGLGEHERAATLFGEALMMSQNMGRKPQAIESLEGMASLAGILGEDTRATHLWGAAEAARGVSGIALSEGERALHEPHLNSARSRLGEKGWEQAMGEGRAMSLDRAIEYALLKEAEPLLPRTPTPLEEPSADQPPVALSPRENEVAVLASRGLSNRQIASRLMLSEHTVATHIRNTLKKLGLHSRKEIAAWFAVQP